ncbi:MAG TPA: hypothetical protein VE974_02655 [Thermoanaerobaculia bacterium]|nr:hypothetical protein [Thermoanaerobaculia bacterium]
MKPLAVLLLLSLSLTAQEKPVTISGLVIGDYYTVVSHHDEEAEGMNGFWIRRGYLTFDRTLSDDLSARLRFEVNSPGDFRTSANIEPYVKDAWVKWRARPALDVMVGMMPTPAFENVERLWGYRSIEKTPLDLQRMASSRDLGVGIMGGSGRLKYHVVAGNGSNTGAETNEGKKVGGAVSLAPSKGTFFELYADTEDRPGDADRSTLQGFAFWQNDRARAGLQYAHQTRDDTGDLDVASVFAVYNLNDTYALIARIDRMFDPNPEGDRIPYLPFDPTRESTLFLAGLDWKLHKNLSIIPNVEYVQYAGGGDADLLPRVTLYFTF